jgi:HK97 family phage prohead protease
MSSGHRHGDEKAASAVADKYCDSAAKLVAACTVVDTFDIPWLANRSTDGKIVYRDRRVPKILKCGVNTDLSLPWHELPEWEAMNDGMAYDTGTPSAHADVATPLERREVERQKPDDPEIWKTYSDEMDGYIREVDDETIKKVPADIDLRPFQDDDQKLLKEIIAAQDDDRIFRIPLSALRPITSRSFATMAKIYTPADLLKRLQTIREFGPKEGSSGEAEIQRLFYDDKGARIAKAIGIEASVALAETERAVDFTISTGSIDRYNSTIAVKGWQTENFQKNSVILWAHDDYIPAIGRAETTRVDGDRLRSRAVFATRDVHPLADTVYALIKAKFINAASVGWIPLKWQFVEDKDRGFGIDYLEQELLEWSVVNIPANPECLVDARSMGIDTKPLTAWAEQVLDRGGMATISRGDLEALRKAAGAPSLHAVRTILRGTATETFADNAGALKTLFKNGVLTADEFADRLIALAEKRAGKAISKKNVDTLKSAYDHAKASLDHCQTACDHIQGVLDQNKDDAADGDGDGDQSGDAGDGDGDGEQAAAAATRKRRLRRLKLAASPALVALAATKT